MKDPCTSISRECLEEVNGTMSMTVLEMSLKGPNTCKTSEDQLQCRVIDLDSTLLMKRGRCTQLHGTAADGPKKRRRIVSLLDLDILPIDKDDTVEHGGSATIHPLRWNVPAKGRPLSKPPTLGCPPKLRIQPLSSKLLYTQWEKKSPTS